MCGCVCVLGWARSGLCPLLLISLLISNHIQPDCLKILHEYTYCMPRWGCWPCWLPPLKKYNRQAQPLHGMRLHLLIVLCDHCWFVSGDACSC